MKQSNLNPFTAILLTAILIIVIYTSFIKKSEQTLPQHDWRAIFTEAMKPLQNKVDSLQRLKDSTVFVYWNIIDTIRLQPFTATVAMLDTMFADTVRYTDSTLLLTHSQGKQVGVWYAERNECREVLVYTELQSAIKDTIIDEQLEVMIVQGNAKDSLSGELATEKPKKWRYGGIGFGIGLLLGVIIR